MLISACGLPVKRRVLRTPNHSLGLHRAPQRRPTLPDDIQQLLHTCRFHATASDGRFQLGIGRIREGHRYTAHRPVPLEEIDDAPIGQVRDSELRSGTDGLPVVE